MYLSTHDEKKRLAIEDTLVNVMLYVLPLRKGHLSWAKYQMVSPYLTIDALDAQNSSGRDAAHIGNTMNSRVGSCGMTGQGSLCIC